MDDRCGSWPGIGRCLTAVWSDTHWTFVVSFTANQFVHRNRKHLLSMMALYFKLGHPYWEVVNWIIWLLMSVVLLWIYLSAFINWLCHVAPNWRTVWIDELTRMGREICRVKLELLPLSCPGVTEEQDHCYVLDTNLIPRFLYEKLETRGLVLKHTHTHGPAWNTYDVLF
jgi:hypothetical protein